MESQRSKRVHTGSVCLVSDQGMRRTRRKGITAVLTCGQPRLQARSDDYPLHASRTPEATMSDHYLGFDVHKKSSQVAVMNSEGEIVEEVRVANADLEEFAQQYAGSKAAIEAGSNYFTIHDRLAEHLDVTVANPAQADWLTNQKQKDDRKDAKNLARYLRLDEVPESYVPPEEYRTYRVLARGRKKLVETRTKFRNEIHALLDQNGVVYSGSLWTEDGREFLRELTLGEPFDLMLEQWLEGIDEFTEKIERVQRKIEQVARNVPEVEEVLMSAPGVAAYSGMMIHGEIGEVGRFDRAAEVVSYAGLDPVVRESGDSRTEGGISKEGSGYLRWILVQSAHTAVKNVKDPYLREFYERLRKRGKGKKKAIVATARKLLVALFNMLRKNESYDPPGVSS